jgi:hypothetical protein
MPSFALLVSIVGTLIIGCIAGTVVWRMWTNQINLSQLLSDDPSTSMSRFQFLVFTFIIGLSYLLLVITRISAVETQLASVADLSKVADMLKELPGVPGGVLGLIGISAGSYVGGKVIQKSADTAVETAKIANPPASTSAPSRAPGAAG